VSLSAALLVHHQIGPGSLETPETRKTKSPRSKVNRPLQRRSPGVSPETRLSRQCLQLHFLVGTKLHFHLLTTSTCVTGERRQQVQDELGRRDDKPLWKSHGKMWLRHKERTGHFRGVGQVMHVQDTICGRITQIRDRNRGPSELNVPDPREHELRAENTVALA